MSELSTMPKTIPSNKSRMVAPAVKAGRSKRAKKPPLSREWITAEAYALISESSLKDFTLARLAQRLDAGVMSLYTYFPSRDALIQAVTDQVFEQLGRVRMDASSPWQELISKRLWATHDLIRKNPFLLEAMLVDGRVSPAFYKHWWIPTAQILNRAGLRGADLALAMWWFGAASNGFICALLGSPSQAKNPMTPNSETLDGDLLRFATETWLDLREVEARKVLDFAFRNIISGLETLIAEGKGPAGQPKLRNGKQTGKQGVRRDRPARGSARASL